MLLCIIILMGFGKKMKLILLSLEQVIKQVLSSTMWQMELIFGIAYFMIQFFHRKLENSNKKQQLDKEKPLWGIKKETKQLQQKEKRIKQKERKVKVVKEKAEKEKQDIKKHKEEIKGIKKAVGRTPTASDTCLVRFGYRPKLSKVSSVSPPVANPLSVWYLLMAAVVLRP